MIPPSAKLLLRHGADINLVAGPYGSLLGKAAYEGNKGLVLHLLAHGADPFHVGGKYNTVAGEYPTALDAALTGKASKDIVRLLSRAMKNKTQKLSDITPWPPFPMPFRSSLAPMEATSTVSACHDCLQTLTNNQTHTWDGKLTPAQAELPCKVIGRELLRRALVALVGVNKEAAEHHQVSRHSFVSIT